MRYVNISEDSQNACGIALGACAPAGTQGPCVSGRDSGIQNSTTNARTADINNDGQVGAVDFFQARSNFGKTIKVNGQSIKVTAQYISLVLSSLGKTVTK